MTRLVSEACTCVVDFFGFNQLHDGLDLVAFTRQRCGHVTCRLRLESGRYGVGAVQLCRGQWRVDTGQCFVNDATQLNAAQCDLAAFLLNVVELFTEEAKVAVLFAERDDGIVYQVFDRLGHSVCLRVPGDAGMHQAGNVLPSDGQVAKDLENGDGFSNVLMQF